MTPFLEPTQQEEQVTKKGEPEQLHVDEVSEEGKILKDPQQTP